jgi:hypothetical protein
MLYAISNMVSRCLSKPKEFPLSFASEIDGKPCFSLCPRIASESSNQFRNSTAVRADGILTCVQISAKQKISRVFKHPDGRNLRQVRGLLHHECFEFRVPSLVTFFGRQTV